MKPHELRPPAGARRPRRRVGRGTGSGRGKTSGRGTKGQGARTSVNLPKTFEGGQTRLTMRTPKLRGFHNRWKKTFTVLNLSRLNRFGPGTEVTPESLIEQGMLKDVGPGIKVLGTGSLRHKLTVHAHRFSAGARKKIEAVGGTAAVIAVPARPAKTKRRKTTPASPHPSSAEEPQPAEAGASPPTPPAPAAPPAKTPKKGKR